MDEELKETTDERLVLPGGDYGGKSEFSKPVIVQTQILRCLELRSKDMRQGFTTWKTDANGQSHPEIVADTRKAFIGAVDVLFNLLAPEIEVWNKELEQDYEDLKKEAFDKYAYAETEGQEYFRSKENPQYEVKRWKYTGRKWLPHLGDAIEVNDRTYTKGLQTIKQKGVWDMTLNAYWDDRLETADELFRELNLVIAKAKYFGKKKGF